MFFEYSNALFRGLRVSWGIIVFAPVCVLGSLEEKKGVCVSLCVWAGLCVSCVCPCVSLCVLCVRVFENEGLPGVLLPFSSRSI